MQGLLKNKHLDTLIHLKLLIFLTDLMEGIFVQVPVLADKAVRG